MSKLLHQPVKPFIINQKFGENKSCIALDGGARVITCDGNNPPVGYKSIYGSKGHLGVDLRASHGKPVHAAQGGYVYKIDTQARSGLDVRIVSIVDGRTIRHIYEHLLSYVPQVLDTVKTGELIGWADNTGWSSGDHLHFQVEEYVNGEWVKIDPLEVMSVAFAGDILKVNNKLAYLIEQVASLADSISKFLRKK